jgi:hypothetical protein
VRKMSPSFVVVVVANSWLFEIEGVEIRCMWCGDVVTALNPCDRPECMEHTGKMAAASAKLDESFRKHPLPFALIPDEMAFRMRVKDYMNEAETM